MKKTIAVLPGDGIGPEVTEAAVKVLQSIAMRYGHTFHLKHAAIGGTAVDQFDNPLPQQTIDVCDENHCRMRGKRRNSPRCSRRNEMGQQSCSPSS